MPRKHRAAAVAARRVPAGPAALSRHGFPGCERRTGCNAGKTGLAIEPDCARCVPAPLPARRRGS